MKKQAKPAGSARLFGVVPILLLCVGVLAPRTAFGQATVASYDFHAGTTQGFSFVPVAGADLHVANGVCGAGTAGHTTPFTLYYGQDGACNSNTGATNAPNAVSP